MLKYNIGDKVLMTNRGFIYPTHHQAAQFMKLSNWHRGGIPKDSPRNYAEEYAIPFTVVGCLSNPVFETLYGLQHPDGNQYIVGVGGMKHFPDFDSGSLVC